MWIYSHIENFQKYSKKNDSSEIQKFKQTTKQKVSSLKQYLLGNSNKNDNIEVLSAEAIQKHLFPQSGQQEIFLSHSHKDEDKVIDLAISLEKRGFNVFVDSCIWSNVFELLRAVDEEYCLLSNKESFDYYKRNISTANIYMILNTALHNMIDQCEIVFFLSTPQSSDLKSYIDQQVISSPWIFSELSFATKVQRKSIFQTAHTFDSVIAEDTSEPSKQQKEFKMAFKLPKADYNISIQDFEEWLNQCTCTCSIEKYMRNQTMKLNLLELYERLKN